MKTFDLTVKLNGIEATRSLNAKNELEASKVAKIYMMKYYGNIPYQINFNNKNYFLKSPYNTCN